MIIDLRWNNVTNIIDFKPGMHNTFQKYVSIYLSNNPLKYDCSVSSFLKQWWTQGTLLDYEEVVFANREHLTDTNINALCSEEDALIGLIGSSVIGSLITLLLLGVIISRRKHIWRYFTNILCKKRDKDDVVTYLNRIDAARPYDVFVSFAHPDEEFVTDILMPKLENEFGQKVCVHFRDWIVGDLIPDQIIKSVDASRKTILILSEHFLESEWSYLEFRTAHKLGIEEKRPKVILILLNKDLIGDNRLTEELKSYIVVDNYLLWSDPDFWEKLQKLLPSQKKIRRKRRNLK